MYYKCPVLSACLLVLSLVACTNETAGYFPLQPGTTWRYNVRATTMDGTEIQRYVVQATGKRQWQGQELPVRTTLDGTRLFYRHDDQGISLVATRHRDQKEPVPLPKGHGTILAYPLEPGTSWHDMSETITLYRTGPPQRTEYRIRVPVRMQYVIEATDDTIKVPAGRFVNCLRVTGRGRKPQYDAGNYIGRTDISVVKTDWYAPGIGLVKSVRDETTTSRVLNQGSMQTFAGKIVFELAAYEPG